MPDAATRASRMVDRMMHDAHLRYQRQQLAGDSTRHMPVSELRGLREDRRWHVAPVVVLPHWFTGLRPNFWKAYLDTMVFMQQ